MTAPEAAGVPPEVLTFADDPPEPRGSYVGMSPLAAPRWPELAQLAADARVLNRCTARIPGVVVTFGALRWHVLCPASTTFDAAEALRLELVAAAPPGVTVDVEIAEGGEGSAEDQAGRRLFGELRGERAASSGDV